MYEISLVPDVKGELIKKQKTRNLVWLICVVVVIACGVVLATLWGTVGSQAIMVSAKEHELKCRSEGDGANKCDASMGTPVYQFNNLSELLTMQDQMKTIR